MPLVTISGQTGSGAHEVGRLTAERLEVDYIDQEILVAAARTLGVPMESVVSHDERTAGLGERLASMLRRFLEQSAIAGAADPVLGGSELDALLGRTYGEAAAQEGPEEVSEDRYIATLTTIIRDLATHDNVVMIGRGSQVILEDRPGVLHTLLVGPIEARIAYIARRDGISTAEAEKLVNERDKGRLSFHQRYFNVNADDPALYHLTVNTALLAPEQAAQIISEAARRVPERRS